MGLCTLYAQKVRFCALLSVHSGIGGNRSSCAVFFFFLRFGLCGSNWNSQSWVDIWIFFLFAGGGQGRSSPRKEGNPPLSFANRGGGEEFPRRRWEVGEGAQAPGGCLQRQWGSTTHQGVPKHVVFKVASSGGFQTSNFGAPYCAIPRDYLSDTPLLRAMGFLVSQHGQFGAIPPPPFLSISPFESMRSGGAIPPHKRGISAILARYHMKTRQMGAIPPSAILSRRGIARYGGVSRTGPLRLAIWCTSNFGTCWGGSLAPKRVSDLMVFSTASSGDFQNK